VAGSTRAAPKPPPPSRVGIADAGDIQTLPPLERGRYLTTLRRAGARWVRVGLYWTVIQRRGRTNYEWKSFDNVVRAARQRGLAILGVILYTPAWARTPGTRDNTPPTDLNDLEAFAFRAARHFGRLGVHAYEIWNEPNIASFWAPAPDPKAYTMLLERAHRGIKRGDPSATVVSGGLSPFAGYGVSDGAHINPVTFLEQMYAAGARSSIDAVGWHPYNFPDGLRYHAWSAWSQMAQTNPSARSIMRANGDAKKKLWATEWGAPTGSAAQSMSETAQAQLVTAALRSFKGWRWAGPAFFYSLRDKGTNSADREENFGLIRHDWSQKPAYAAFQREVARRR
jgi:hypothetical protein